MLVPEHMSPLHVRSEVCMAPFHVRSKVCIAPIHVQNKVCQFAPHMDGSNADFASHMEGRRSFRDQQIAKIAIFTSFQKYLFKTTYILGVFMSYVTI